MYGKITINDLKGKSVQVRIVKRATYVGKDKNCDIRIEKEKVDDRQFVISAGNRGLVKIQNLSKKFPTRLNEQPIDFEVQHDLKENDVIAIGNTEMSWTYQKTGNTPVAPIKQVASKRPRTSEPARKVAVVTPNCRESVVEEEDEHPTKRPRHHCQAGPFTPQPSAFARRSMYDRGLKSKHPTPSTRGRPSLCTPLGSAKKKRIGFSELGTPKLQYDHAAAFNKSITPRTFFGHSGPSKPFTFGAFSRVGTSRGAVADDSSYHEGSDHPRGRRSGRVSTPFPNKKLSTSFSSRTPRSKGASGLYFPAIEEGRNAPSPGRSDGTRGGFMDVASSILIPPMAARDSTPSSYFSPSGSGSPRIMRAESPNITANTQPGLPYPGRRSLMSNSPFGTPQERFHDSREQDSMYVNASSKSQSQMRDFNDSRFPENGHYWDGPHQNAYPMTPPSMRTPRRSRANESPGSAKFSPMSCDTSYVLLSPRGRSITANRGYGSSEYLDSRLLMSAPSRSDFNFTASPERSKSHISKTPKRSLSMQVLARSLQKKLHRSMSEAKRAYPLSSDSSPSRSPVRHVASPGMNSLSHLGYGDFSEPSSSSQANGELPKKNSRRSKNDLSTEDIKSPKGQSKKKSVRNESPSEDLASTSRTQLQDSITPKRSRVSARQSVQQDDLSSHSVALNNRRSRASKKGDEHYDSSVTSPRSTSAPFSRRSRRSGASEKVPPVEASPSRSVPDVQSSSDQDSLTKTPSTTRKSANAKPPASAGRSRSKGDAANSPIVSPTRKKSDANAQSPVSARRSRSKGKEFESPNASPARMKKSGVSVQQVVPTRRSRSTGDVTDTPKSSAARKKSVVAILQPSARQSPSSVGASENTKVSQARSKKSDVPNVQQTVPTRRSRASGVSLESPKESPTRKSDVANVQPSASARRSRSSAKAPESPKESPARRISHAASVQQSSPARRSRSSAKAPESPKESPTRRKSDVANVQSSASARRSRSSAKAPESPKESPTRRKSDIVANVQQSSPAKRSRSSAKAPESPKESIARSKSHAANVLTSSSARTSRSSAKAPEIPKESPTRRKSDVANVQPSASARRSRSSATAPESPKESPARTKKSGAANAQQGASPSRRSLSSSSLKTRPCSSLIEEAGTSRTTPVVIGPRRSKSVPAVNIKVEPVSDDSSRSRTRLETSQPSLRQSLKGESGRSPAVSVKKSSSALPLLNAVKTEPAEDSRRSKRSPIKGQIGIQNVSKISASNSLALSSSQDATVCIADLSEISGPRKTRVEFSSPPVSINKRSVRVTSTPFPRGKTHSRTRNSECFDPLSTLTVDTSVAQSSYVCSNSPAYDTIIMDKVVDASEVTFKGSPKRSPRAPVITIIGATPSRTSRTPSPVKTTHQRRSAQSLPSPPGTPPANFLPGTPPPADSPPVVMRSSRKRSPKAGTSTSPSTPTSCFRKNPRRKVKKATPSASLVWKRMRSSTPRQDTPVKKLSLDPEKPDKKKMAALIACHKKKSPTKGSRRNVPGPSEEQDPNITLTPLKDLDKEPEETSPEDALLNALDLSRKSTLAPEPQKPARRLRSAAFKRASLPLMPRLATPPSVTKSVKKLLFKSPLVEYENNHRSPKRVASPTRTIKSILMPSPTTSSDEPMSRIFTTSPVMDYTDSSGKKKSFRASPTSKSSVIKELIPAEEIDLEGVRNLFETLAAAREPSRKRGRKGGPVDEESPSKVARVSPKATPAKNTRSRQKAVEESASGQSTKTRGDGKGASANATPKQKSGAKPAATSKTKAKVSPLKRAAPSAKSQKAVVSAADVSLETPPPAPRSQTKTKKGGQTPKKTQEVAKRNAKAPSKPTSPKPGPSAVVSPVKKVTKKRVSLVVRKVSLVRSGKSDIAKPKKATAKLQTAAKAEPTVRNAKVAASPKAVRATRGAGNAGTSKVPSSKAKARKSVAVKKKPSPAKPRKNSSAKAPKSAPTKKRASLAKPKKTTRATAQKAASPKPSPSKRAVSKKPVSPKEIAKHKKRSAPKSAPAKTKSPLLKAGKTILVKKRASLAKPKKTARAVAPKASSKLVAKAASPKPGPSKRAVSKEAPSPKKIAAPKKRGTPRKVATPKAVKKPKASPAKSKIAPKPKNKPSPAKPKKVAKAPAVKSSQGAAKKKDKTSPAKPTTPRKTRNAAKKR